MKKIIKEILKYVLIFVFMVIVLLSLLVATAKIPKNTIEKNLKQSIVFFNENKGVEWLKKKKNYTSIHYYADTMLLNIIYCIDTQKPLESVMWSKYYETIKMDVNYDFIEVVENQKEPTQQYLRYWHGSMVILRPLLTFLNIEQIYTLNKILLWILAIILLIILWNKSKKLAVIYVIAMVMIVFPVVPFCLEYSWTFYIMFITSIVAILIEKKGDKWLNVLFFASGIITCFLDFLTTELITILIPIVLVLAIRKKEKRLTNFKQGFIFLVKGLSLWFVAYVCMWITKWALASIILNINALDYVKENALQRINGLQGLHSYKEMYIGAICNNLKMLPIISEIKDKPYLKISIILVIVILLLCVDWKNIKDKWFSKLMLIIAILPYVRYLILANHSYRHAFFSFRTQIITIICLLLIYIDCLNYKILHKQIKIKKK